jgi:hypothetical protein
MAAVVVLLATLPEPSADGVDSVYHQLKEQLPHPFKFWPLAGWVIQTGVWNPRHAIRPIGGTRTHSPSAAHKTHIGVDVMTRRDATSVLRDWGKRHSDVTCVTHGSQNTSRHQTTSSNTTKRQTPASG